MSERIKDAVTAAGMTSAMAWAEDQLREWPARLAAYRARELAVSDLMRHAGAVAVAGDVVREVASRVGSSQFAAGETAALEALCSL